MIVASINLDTGKAMLFSISRDMVYAPLPEDWDDAFIEDEYEEAVEPPPRRPAWSLPREGFEERPAIASPTA